VQTNALKAWLKKPWGIPEVSTALVAAMADVRAGSAAPYDPRRPKGHWAETNHPLLKETRLPLPAQPGQPQRYDDADARNGTRHLFRFVAPQAGGRPGHVTEQRTKRDGAHQRQWLGEERAPEAEVVRVPLAHLHTPKPASLSEAFPPAEARRIARKRAWHDTPKAGSWLPRAASAWRVLQPPC
jgi:hypothetical protein